MTDRDLNKFLECCKDFCSIVEDAQKYSEDELGEKLVTVLGSLYLSGLTLPDIEPSSEDIEEIDTLRFESFSGHNIYWEVFDPYENDEPVCGSLNDDISDIFADIKRGLAIFEKGSHDDMKNAVWFWKLHFLIHWGYHAVNALRALHWAIYK